MTKVRTLLLGCLFPVLTVTMLSGCDQITEVLNKQKANGKATGAACRHSGRALEDCFRRNPRISRADIFAGWKEMNDYMQQHKMDVVPPPPDDMATQSNHPEANIASDAGGGDMNAEPPTDNASKPTEKHAKP